MRRRDRDERWRKTKEDRSRPKVEERWIDREQVSAKKERQRQREREREKMREKRREVRKVEESGQWCKTKRKMKQRGRERERERKGEKEEKGYKANATNRERNVVPIQRGS